MLRITSVSFVVYDKWTTPTWGWQWLGQGRRQMNFGRAALRFEAVRYER